MSPILAGRGSSEMSSAPHNAAQHGGETGTITIAGRRSPDAVLLSISDQGPGLPHGCEQRIFETFAQGRGSDRHGGSGLGLAIVKGFADVMGITATARNREDGGAVFTLTFPISSSGS